MVIDLDAQIAASVAPGRRRGAADVLGARPAAIVAVLLLVILTVGGSAAPLPGLRRVLAVENTSGAFALAPAALFTANFGPAPGRQAIVRRHSLDGRSSRWSTELAQTVGSLHVVGPAQVLAVGPAQVLMTTSVDSLRTTFLDSGTGRILWTTTTDGVLRLADTSALMIGGTGGSGVLRRADLRTGRTLWSRELGSSGYLDAGDSALGPSSHIVMVDQRGHATVVSFADGAVAASAELGVAPSRTEDDGLGDTAMYAATGAHLYLARRDNGQASLTAYRLPDLQPLWRNTTAPPARPTSCGPHHLCVGTAAGLTVLDSDTGTMRWSDKRWRSGFDTRAIGIPGPARIAVVDSRPDTGRALLDPATGTTLSTLGPGTLVGANLLRPDLNEIGRTWVRVTGPRSTIRTVGAVDTVAPGRCAATADHLACPTSSGRLTVWRIPA
jgi:PQQ-like domain